MAGCWFARLAMLALAVAACARTPAGGGADAAAARDVRAPDEPGGDGPMPPGDAASPPLADFAMVIIRPGGDNAVNHLECAINAAGEGIAVWREADNDFRPQVWGARLLGGAGAWQPAERLSVRAAPEIDGPLAAIDGSGRALVLWNESGDAAGGVVVTAHPPGGGWTPAARISGGWVSTVLASAAGDTVAFGAIDGRPATLLRYLPGTGWGAPDESLALERAGSFFAGTAGHAVLAWSQPTGGSPDDGHELYTSAHGPPPARGWSAPARVHEARASAQSLPILNGMVGGDGSGLLVWSRGDDRAGELWAALRSPGAAAWQEPHRLQDGERLQWTTTAIRAEATGTLVVWESGSSPRKRVWAALHHGGGWQPPTMLADRSELATGALAASGDAVVAWSTPGYVYARRYSPSRGWGPTRAAMGNNSGIADLCAAVDSLGRGWIVWVNGSPQAVRAAAIVD